MTMRFQIGGKAYDADALSNEGKALVEQLRIVHLEMQ